MHFHLFPKFLYYSVLEQDMRDVFLKVVAEGALGGHIQASRMEVVVCGEPLI